MFHLSLDPRALPLAVIYLGALAWMLVHELYARRARRMLRGEILGLRAQIAVLRAQRSHRAVQSSGARLHRKSPGAYLLDGAKLLAELNKLDGDQSLLVPQLDGISLNHLQSVVSSRLSHRAAGRFHTRKSLNPAGVIVWSGLFEPTITDWMPTFVWGKITQGGGETK